MPCANHLALSNLFDSSSKTSIKTLPIILRFASGSLSPAKRSKNLSSASIFIIFKPKWSPNISMTCWPSSKRSKPLSTNTQVNLSPIARCNNIATTDESTPPERPKITSSSPTWAFIFAIASSMIDDEVHNFSHWQISTTKFSKMRKPCLVWVTSGWNCTP